MKSFILLCTCLLYPISSGLAQGMSSAKEITPHIMVTLPPLAGLVAMLLPEQTSECLLSASADPHHFQPSPQQVEQLHVAKLLVRARRDDQGWPIRSHQSNTITLFTQQAHGWLNFADVKIALPDLAAQLSKMMPTEAARIQASLPQALAQVEAIETQWKPVLSQLKTKGVLMQHPAWQALFDAYDIPIWAVLESAQHGHEHGPKHLEEALDTLNQHQGAVLIGSLRHSNRSLDWLNAHQSHAQAVLSLDALGTCNMPWSELMTSNMQALQSQL